MGKRRISLVIFPLVTAASLALVFGAALTGMLSGCGSGDLTLAEADPDAVPADPDFELVFSIVQRECTPCHKEGGEDGGDDAPARAIAAAEGEDPRLVDCLDIVENAEEIYATTVGNNTMPPGAWPRLTSEEKLVIERWIENGVKAPCK
jgi:uncharacterized membrane protein